MARPVKKPPEQWESEILSAAQRLFMSKGYEETAITDIMEAVGGATGMFYRCFQNKEEILNVLVEKWAALYAQKITLLLSDPQSSFCEKFISILSVIREMSSQTIGMDAFFTASNEIMLNKLTKRMTCTLVPLLSSVLNSGVKEGILSVENPDFYANYIINGSLGALNRGDNSARENIAHNIDYLPQAIANTLKIEISFLTNGEMQKGREINENCKRSNSHDNNYQTNY